MKIKKFDKKLVLKKETITNLKSDHMQEIKGGAKTIEIRPLSLCVCTTDFPVLCP